MATYAAKGGGKDFEKCEEGTHMAVCTLVADVGLQPGNPKFTGVVDKNGKPDSRGLPTPKVYLRWEVPGQRITYERDGVETEGPAIIYANFRASMNEKATLRKMIESWRGKGFTDAEAEQFDVRNLIGQTCMLQVVHSDDGQYANVKNVMAPPKGTPKLAPEGKTLYFGPDDDAAYNELPNFLKEKWDGQLDNKPAPAPTKSGNARQQVPAAEIAQAQREVSRQAAREADHGSPSLDPDDEIPFAPRGKRSHWD